MDMSPGLRVLRLEHVTSGRGPLREMIDNPRFALAVLGPKRRNSPFMTRFPAPTALPGPIGQLFRTPGLDTRPWVFGFRPDIALADVFRPSALDALERSGFRPVIYEAPHGTAVVEGDQVAFLRHRATRVALEDVRDIGTPTIGPARA